MLELHGGHRCCHHYSCHATRDAPDPSGKAETTSEEKEEEEDKEKGVAEGLERRPPPLFIAMLQPPQTREGRKAQLPGWVGLSCSRSRSHPGSPERD